MWWEVREKGREVEEKKVERKENISEMRERGWERLRVPSCPPHRGYEV